MSFGGIPLDEKIASLEFNRGGDSSLHAARIDADQLRFRQRNGFARSSIVKLFGAIQPGGAVQNLATIPEILWELSLGLYLTIKGFRPSPITPMDPVVMIPERMSAERSASGHASP